MLCLKMNVMKHSFQTAMLTRLRTEVRINFKALHNLIKIKHYHVNGICI